MQHLDKAGQVKKDLEGGHPVKQAAGGGTRSKGNNRGRVRA